SNDRVVSLGALQVRAAAYGQLQQQVDDLRNVLAENVGGDFFKVWTEVKKRKNSEAIDLHAASAVRRIEAATTPDHLLFTPPAEDQDALESIRSTAHDLWLELKHEIIPLYKEPHATTKEDLTSARVSVERLSGDLKDAVAALSLGTRAEVQELIDRNASSFARSRALFIGVAAGAL